MREVSFPLGALALLLAVSVAAGERVVYVPTWESLDLHATPEWLMDAKFGLFIYGIQATEAEWNAYWSERGEEIPTYNYRRLAWDSGKWDPEGLVELTEAAGARYLTFGIGFPFVDYPSRYAGLPDSPIRAVRGRDGKPKDYVGEIADALRNRGLKLGILYGYRHPARNPYWFESMQEVIDRYQPSLLWWDDDKLSFPSDELRTREMLAYYYNHLEKQEEAASEDMLGSEKQPHVGLRQWHGDWFRKEARDKPGADDISEGYYIRYEELLKADWITVTGDAPRGIVATYLHWLIHSVAHGGGIELALGWDNGEFMPQARRSLRQMGDWLEVNGEAIYGSRPWRAGRPAGKTGDNKEVRFTTRGDSLYAILFDWPGEVMQLKNLKVAEGTQMEMLGRMTYDEGLRWEQEADGVRVIIPYSGTANTGPVDYDNPDRYPYRIVLPCSHAFTIKITPIPIWED
jgi:alpha-L-fucosidase